MAKLSMQEIQMFETKSGHTLPGLYRKLLVEVGHGEVGRDCQIYHPSEVRELYEPFFDDPAQLFDPFFPFGCNNRTQEVWVIDSSTETAASISHETHPDDWPEEEWLEYDSWINRYLDPVT